MPSPWLRSAVIAVAVLAVVISAPTAMPHAPGLPARGASGAPPPTVGGEAAATPVEVAPGFSVPAGVHELGPVPNATDFDIAVGLAPRNLPALTAYLTGVYAPGSTEYHHFLAPSALAAEYGPPPAEVAESAAYFAARGLSVAVSPDHLLLTVEGPATAVGAAFGTSFEEFERPGGGWFVSHLAPARLPAGLPWSGALGLGNATALVPSVVGEVPGPAAGPDAGCGPAPTGFAPCQVWQAYNFTGLLDAGTNGTGTTLAVVDDYDGAESEIQLERDLQQFDSSFALPVPTVHYEYPVPTSIDLNDTSTGWGLEESLDLEWAHATAPGATLDMTFAPNSGAGLYEAVDSLVAHQSANVISLSWGEPDTGVYNAFSGACLDECNASSDGSYALLAPVLTFAAAEGITVVAATGDCGSADGTSGVATNYPASDPFVTAVGGTTLTVDSGGNWTMEVGWSGNATGARSPGCENQGGSGGGFSPFPRPYWQAGPGVPTNGLGRATPDVSAVSTPGVAIVHGGSTEGVEGTSVATPIWGGIAAIADQNAGADLGFLDPSLYSILGSGRYSADFHDIVSGDNGYSAGTGWDPVTGIGTPIVDHLVTDLALRPASVSTLATTLNASATAGLAPLTVAYSANATGGTGVYPWRGVYFGDGNASFASGGAVNYTYTIPGVYPAQSYVADSGGNFSTSAPIAVVVGGGGALGVSLGASDTTPAVDAPVTFTATTAGGDGPYAYLYWFGDGTYQNWTSAASLDHSYGAPGSFCAVVLVRDSATAPDGGTSLPIAIAAGGASPPTCPAGGGPLSVLAAPSGAVRDAPADFPGLFHVSGGAGTISEQYVATDPYAAACECAIFRSSGADQVRLFVNDSAGAHVVAETNVTVAAPLVGIFHASPTFGAAPLTVDFSASSVGGTDASAARTYWTLGDGDVASGASVDETYATPGLYWATATLADAGHGNASEAFLIDVARSGSSQGPYVTASIDPARNVTSGSTVAYDAAATWGNGTPVAAGFAWQLGSGSTAYTAGANRTSDAPTVGASSYRDSGNLTVDVPSAAVNVSAGFSFGSFFAVEPGGFVPRADALSFADSGGPPTGEPPLNWSGSGSVVGVGSTTIAWGFGDGAVANGPSANTTYGSAGRFTVVVWSNDSWGDRAVDSLGANVTGGPSRPIELTSTASVLSGSAPLAVRFLAYASGGAGGPYRFAWQFGDGTGSAQGNVTHTYDAPGTYRANVTVTDAVGDRASRSFAIDVAPAAPGRGPSGPLPGNLLLPVVLGGVGTAALVAVVASRRRPPPTP
jgi:PKD repeat protein